MTNSLNSFDDITWLLPPHATDPKHKRIRLANDTEVYGIVRLTDAAELSDEGVEEIQRICSGRRAPKYRFPMNVIIYFKNNMQARFDTNDKRDHDALLIYSETR